LKKGEKERTMAANEEKRVTLVGQLKGEFGTRL